MERYPGEVDELRAEAARLRALLRLKEGDAPLPAGDQASIGTVTMASRPIDKLRLYRSLFIARSDVHAIRWQNIKDGRSGWMPAIEGRWHKGMNPDNASYLPLTDDVLERHLRGDLHIGLYALTKDDSCRWLAADFDKDSAMLDALSYVKAARKQGIPAALEVSQSGRGAHAWIFFADQVPSALAREMGTGLIREASALRNSMSLDSYDRLFPSQDTHLGRGLGNLIAAPLNGRKRIHGTTVFLDPATLEPFEDQWALLSTVHRLSTNEVRRALAALPKAEVGRSVRRVALPTSSKIVPQPAIVIRATLRARLQLTADDLGPAMISSIKHASSIQNPEFYDRQRRRLSTWNTPRFLESFDETVDGDLILPRGLISLLTEMIKSVGSRLQVTDTREVGAAMTFAFDGELRSEQIQALNAAMSVDHCVIVAQPGAGKTVIACAAIAKRSTSTLVLVDRKALADQWRERIEKYLGVKAGQIGGGRKKLTGSIDVGLLPTLARRDDVEALTSPYGFVVVDECHHVPGTAFSTVLNQIPSKYWLGLTATPYRRDGLDDLIFHQIGSTIHSVESGRPGELTEGSADAPPPERKLVVHSTTYEYSGDADPSRPGGMAEIYRDLVADEARLALIADDVSAASQEGSNILVLTTWTTHLERLVSALAERGHSVTVLRGGMGAKARKAAVQELTEQQSTGIPMLAVAIGSFIGEGFDIPAFDTLFLAAPISFKGRLVQYVGRVVRSHPGKTTATVHDYHDALTPVLASSLNKRAPGYLDMGFPDPRKVPSARFPQDAK
ncbi:DEAD/DEAH box helicase [Rhodococcus sp. SBT000017]|uniref:DEAD/DEAH box helicase n=1 Tax=Rhodococcus sp. SBT000017 TaxID=1803385 RepID=UPI000EF8659A|nr:DEAD/DEAH box helicase [Rhodococcus sp. SBT000017]RMB71836.1 DEAD/DEAH box helicase [Rhodococcus sp. SBT000017]